MATEKISEIFDIQAIQKQISTVEADIKKVLSLMDDVAKKAVEAGKQIGAAGNMKEMSKAIEEVNKAREGYNKTTSELSKLEAQEAQLKVKLGEAYLQQYEKIERVRQQVAEETRTIRENIKAEREAASSNQYTAESIEALIQKYNKQRKSKADLTKANKEFRKIANNLDIEKEKDLIEKLNQVIDENTELIKDNSDSLSQQKMNVGNYQKSIEGALQSQIPFLDTLRKIPTGAGALGTALKGAGTAVKGFAKELLVLLANPIVATIAAITAAIVALRAASQEMNDTIKQSEELTAKYNEASAAEMVFDDEKKRQKEELAKTYIKVKNAIMEVAASFIDFIRGNDQYSKKVEEYEQLEKDRQKLLEKTREVNEENAKRENEISELRGKAVEKNKHTETERIHFLEEAKNLELAISKDRIDIAKENLRILEEEGKRTQNTTEFNEKLSQARIAVIKAETDYNNKSRELTTQITETQNQFMEKEKANAQARIQIINLEIQKRIEANQLIINDSKKTYKERLEAQNEYEKLSITSLEKQRESELANQKLSEDQRTYIIKKYEKQIQDLKDQVARERINLENNQKNAIIDLENARLKISTDANKRIYEDQKKTLKERLEAQDEFENETIRMIINEGKKAVEGLDSSSEEFKIINADVQNNITAIQEQGTKDREKIMKSEVDKRTKGFGDMASSMELSMLKEQQDLAKLYEKGLISREDYENESLNITKKYENQVLQMQKASIEGMLNSLNLPDDVKKELLKQLEDVNKKITQSSIEMSENTRAAWEKNLAKIADRLSKFGDMAGQLSNVLSSFFQNRIDQMDIEIEKIDEEKEAQLESIDEMQISEEEKEARKEVLEKKAEKQKEQLEKRKKKEQRKQAIVQRTNDIIQSEISTALGIMATAADLGFPAAIPWIAALSALGAIQTATIAAQPLPRYAKGTENHPGGPAIVGDAGKKELVITPRGEYFITPDMPTVMDIPAHSEILPDFSKAITSLATAPRIDTDITSFYNYTRLENKIEELGDRLERSLEKNRSNFSVNLDKNGVWKTYDEHKGNTTYINERLNLRR